MKTSEKTSVRSVEETAGDWFLRREAGLTTAETTEFDAWLAADARHAQALAEFERTWRRLAEPRARGFAADALATLAHRRAVRVRRRMWTAVSTVTFAAAALVVFAFLPRRESLPAKAMPPSVAFRPDRQTLPDGSVVELNAGARYEMRFTESERGIRLVRGEALFFVKKDATRPFVVSAGAVSVRAVGTAFSVRHEAASVDVLVTEGRVAVERAAAEARPASPVPELPTPTFVSAGGKVSVQMAAASLVVPAPTAVSPGQIAQALAWRSKRIEFTETPLVEVLRLFNRQANPLRLEVADAAAGELEVSGIFWADDPEAFVRLIETALNLRAERTGHLIRLRQK